ncbi:hypothetical protein GCM10009766_11010 [Microcella frigidaquae]
MLRDRVSFDGRGIDVEVHLEAIAGCQSDGTLHGVMRAPRHAGELFTVDSKPFERIKRRVAVVRGDAEEHGRTVYAQAHHRI